MVDLIREKIAASTPAMMTTNIKQKRVDDNLSQPNQSSNILTKKVLPLTLIAGGGMLIYYGVKSPSATKFLKNLVKERISTIENRAADFADDAKSYIWEQFREANTPILEYIQHRVVMPKQIVKTLEKSNSTQEILSAQDEAFGFLQKEMYKDIRAGANDFDNFTSYLHRVKRSASDYLNNQRHQTNLSNGDLIALPEFKDGKRQDLIESLSSQIDEKVKSSADEMVKVVEDVCAEYMHEKSSKMAEAVMKKRDSFTESKRLIIDTTFSKVRNTLGLGEDFASSYSKIPTLDNFSKLSKKELKPQELPNGTEQIFNGTMFGEILKTQDFSKLDENALRVMFLKTLPTFNVEDVGIMADRLRLKAIVEKDKELYRVPIAKLEFLQNKLQEVGEKELFKRLQIDFTDMTSEQKRARFSYINDVARRLGFNNLEQMHTTYSETKPEYLKTSFSKCIDEIKQSPELFFF